MSGKLHPGIQLMLLLLMPPRFSSTSFEFYYSNGLCFHTMNIPSIIGK